MGAGADDRRRRLQPVAHAALRDPGALEPIKRLRLVWAGLAGRV